jgi:hypothetical protein
MNGLKKPVRKARKMDLKYRQQTKKNSFPGEAVFL